MYFVRKPIVQVIAHRYRVIAPNKKARNRKWRVLDTRWVTPTLRMVLWSQVRMLQENPKVTALHFLHNHRTSEREKIISSVAISVKTHKQEVRYNRQQHEVPHFRFAYTRLRCFLPIRLSYRRALRFLQTKSDSSSRQTHQHLRGDTKRSSFYSTIFISWLQSISKAAWNDNEFWCILYRKTFIRNKWCTSRISRLETVTSYATGIITWRKAVTQSPSPIFCKSNVNPSIPVLSAMRRRPSSQQRRILFYLSAPSRPKARNHIANLLLQTYNTWKLDNGEVVRSSCAVSASRWLTV